MSAPAIGVRQRWASRPAAIDWSHPLAQGLLYCLFADGARVVDLVSGRALTNLSNATTGSTPFGAGLNSRSAQSGAFLTVSAPPPYPMSMTWVGSTQGNGSGLLCFAWGVSGGWTSETSPFLLGVAAAGSGGPQLELYRVNGSTLLAAMTASVTTCSATTGVMASGNQVFYTDGAQRATATATLTNATSSSLSGLGFNAYTQNTSVSAASGKLGLVHGRALSAAEVAALHADPFQILRQ